VFQEGTRDSASAAQQQSIAMAAKIGQSKVAFIGNPTLFCRPRVQNCPFIVRLWRPFYGSAYSQLQPVGSEQWIAVADQQSIK
jgi:hypothetical protein